MTFPRDTEPMRRAVELALTTYTGQPRCLPAAGLFRLGKPKDVLTAPPAGQVYGVQPICVVMPIRWREIESMTLTDRMRVDARIEIRCWYHAGKGVGTDAWERASARWSRDSIDVVNALTYPGALEIDDEGESTGLDGYALRSDGNRHTYDPRALPRTEPTDAVIVQVTHLFDATADLSRP